MSGPYAQAAAVYFDRGWAGPIPVIGKSAPVQGFTGRSGEWPDEAILSEWITERGSDNIGLRLADNVIGIDVDAYDGRNGARTIRRWEVDFGPLPSTWYSTSRDDGESGIRFYRVPEGMSWRSGLGTDSGVEIIQRHHRYAVVWPSMHPDTGMRYRWYSPHGHESDEPPNVDDLPELPAAWVQALQRNHDVSHVDSRTLGDHSGEDVETFDMDGQPVNVEEIFEHGAPIGSQNSVLYAYLSSMRARGAKRIEMITMGAHLIEKFENDPRRDPWTTDDVIRKVDEIRRDYSPGTMSFAGMSPAMQEFAERVRSGQASVDEAPPRDPLATDLGNSLRFVRMFRNTVRFASDENRWYIWDGNRWDIDRTGQIYELANHVVDDIRTHAMTMGDNDDRAAWIRWAHQTESLARRKTLIDGAKSHPEIVVTADEFDRDPWLFVVRNGTIDLRTGQLRQSKPEDMCSKQAEVTFDPEADCPKWKEHIRFVSCDTPELAQYLMIMAGYSLTGLTSERKFFFIEGSGRNGKNVFVEPIIDLMGSYAGTASSSLLTGGDEQHPTILADLRGTRFVFIDEVRQGKQLNVERIKALTGSKRIKARRMREDFFEFDAQFKLWIAGNGQPAVRDRSDGAWDRMMEIPFLGRVESQQLIRDYAQQLYQEEAPGILNWLLQGVVYWSDLHEKGITLPVPDVVQTAVAQHRHSEDEVIQFAEDFPIEYTGNANDYILVSEVYQTFKNWATLEMGIPSQSVPTRISFGMRYTKIYGIESKRRRIGSRVQGVYVGWRWMPSGDENGAESDFQLPPGDDI